MRWLILLKMISFHIFAQYWSFIEALLMVSEWGFLLDFEPFDGAQGKRRLSFPSSTIILDTCNMLCSWKVLNNPSFDTILLWGSQAFLMFFKVLLNNGSLCYQWFPLGMSLVQKHMICLHFFSHIYENGKLDQ